MVGAKKPKYRHLKKESEVIGTKTDARKLQVNDLSNKENCHKHVSRIVTLLLPSRKEISLVPRYSEGEGRERLAHTVYFVINLFMIIMQ